MAAREIYLVRHAESEWNAVGRWQGQADPPLSERGQAQARALAAHFPHAGLTHLFASDLQRAHSTSLPLAERFGLEVQLDRNLRELDVGSWSGKTRDEIAADEPGALELFFQGVQGWQGGESYEQHEQRAEAFTAHLRALPDDSQVCAVTHGGTMRALLLALLEVDGSLRWKFAGAGHTSITHLTLGGFGYRMRTYNSMLELEHV